MPENYNTKYSCSGHKTKKAAPKIFIQSLKNLKKNTIRNNNHCYCNALIYLLIYN